MSAMTGQDLRLKNATLREKIEKVLIDHPELREVTEEMALNQDLHVQMGAPFLERTHCKLQERARIIIERRPDLERYFGDTVLVEVGDSSREVRLETALRANAALRTHAERLIADYAERASDRPKIIAELISLFDGPTQREAQMLAAEALGEAWREHRS